MKIYVKFKKPDTLKEFLYKFFDTLNKNSAQTFSDVECKVPQCDAGRRRSFDDLYDIVTTYFPEATIEEILKELILLKPALYFYPYVCGTINRPVITWMHYKLGHEYDSNHFKKIGFSSKYSWETLFQRLDPNITGYDKMYEYIEKIKEEQNVKTF